MSLEDKIKPKKSLTRQFQMHSTNSSMSQTTLHSKSLTIPKHLPEIKRTSIHLNTDSHYSLPSTSYSTMMFERLSGLYKSTDYESFPDRGTVVHPLSICFRCSAEASLCVPCADTMRNDAVDFFRKSKAIGAYHLFKNAIKQAGAMTILRFIVFNLWKNSLLKQRKYDEHKDVVVNRYLALRLTRVPFQAWKRFTQACQSERNDKLKDELNAKIKLLEMKVNQLQLEKNSADKQIIVLQTLNQKADEEIKRLNECNEDITASYEQQISSLQNYIEKDKRRIILMADVIITVIPKLFYLAYESVETIANQANKCIELSELVCTYVPNFSKVVKNRLKKATSRVPAAPISSDGAYFQFDEYVEALLQWVNVKSRACSGLFHDSNKNSIHIDKMLPPYTETKNLESLYNWKQLARVVVRLIIDTTAAPANDVAKPNSESGCLSASGSETTFTVGHLNDIKSGAEAPDTLLYILVCHMKTFLSLPTYDITLIASKDPNVMILILSQLMLCSTSRQSKPMPEDEAYIAGAITAYGKFVSELPKLESTFKKSGILDELGASMVAFKFLYDEYHKSPQHVNEAQENESEHILKDQLSAVLPVEAAEVLLKERHEKKEFLNQHYETFMHTMDEFLHASKVDYFISENVPEKKSLVQGQSEGTTLTSSSVENIGTAETKIELIAGESTSESNSSYLMSMVESKSAICADSHLINKVCSGGIVDLQNSVADLQTYAKEAFDISINALKKNKEYIANVKTVISTTTNIAITHNNNFSMRLGWCKSNQISDMISEETSDGNEGIKDV